MSDKSVIWCIENKKIFYPLLTLNNKTLDIKSQTLSKLFLKTKKMINKIKKTIYILLTTLVLMSCMEKPKDYVTLSGTITNKRLDTLLVIGPVDAKKKEDVLVKSMVVNPDGTFSDTLKVKPGFYHLSDRFNSTIAYLKNGYDLKIGFDNKAYLETYKYEGNGAETNNYMVKKQLVLRDLQDFFNSPKFKAEGISKADYDKKVKATFEGIKSQLYATKNRDTIFMDVEERDIEKMYKAYAEVDEKKLDPKYAEEQAKKKQEDQEALLALKGQESPKFTDYENHAGGTTSLDNLKGKYVYIDVWATWCAPCKKEIPFLKEMETAYRGKNIAFVSISVDKMENREKWKKMVENEALSGIQLLADKNFESAFIEAYKITGIPRFILIDPQGNVIDPNAPRPSSDDLKTLLDKLGI